MTAIPRGDWLCVELTVQLGDPGSFSLDFDGTSHVAESNQPLVSENTGYEELRIGIVSTANQQARITIELDDVRLATSPIPCD